jgi:Glyoxalase-like domain
LLFAPGDGPRLLFIRVPEGKAAKNRLHLDLQPDIPRDEEVERLLGLGATMVLDMRQPDGRGWAQLADPEGNEFCVERSAAERKALGDDGAEKGGAGGTGPAVKKAISAGWRRAQCWRRRRRRRGRRWPPRR